jgi:hypothetical protein
MLRNIKYSFSKIPQWSNYNPFNCDFEVHKVQNMVHGKWT